MGRADQTTKVKGMFVHPGQLAQIGKRHAELGRLRLVVARAGEQDVMTLMAECAAPAADLQEAGVATLRAVTKLGGEVKLVAAGSLPNDGKVIAGERPGGGLSACGGFRAARRDTGTSAWAGGAKIACAPCQETKPRLRRPPKLPGPIPH